jgi:hypothetical protein
MLMKGQNAVEFLSNYTFVILIITVAIVFVLILANAPKSVFPSECNIYGGFSCAGTIYSINTTANSGSRLFVEIADSEPGIVNISSFSATIGQYKSNAWYCTPKVAMEGQKVYCTANFAYTPALGNVYSGTFNVSANYCPEGYGLNYSCASSSSYSYIATIETQAEKQQVYMGPYYYLPLTATNLALSAPTQAGFQMQVNLTSSSYSQYERSDLGNLRFYYGAMELNSWCESGCNSNSSKTIFWIKLPNSIPANSATSLQLYFLPNNIDYSGRYAGEAPQLSPIYAEYDNGESVFNSYANFAGTNLSSSFTPYVGTNGNISVNNGLKLKVLNDGCTSTWAGIIYNNPIYSADSVVETYSSGVRTSGPEDVGIYVKNSDIATGYAGVADTWGWGGGSIAGGYYNIGNPFDISSGGGVASIYWLANGNEGIGWNYVFVSSSNTGEIWNSSLYASIQTGQCSPNANMVYYWFRVRDYPPDGIMPSVSTGSITAV